MQRILEEQELKPHKIRHLWVAENPSQPKEHLGREHGSVAANGNHLLGWMKTRGLGDNACLLFLGSCYLLGAVVLSFLKNPD